MANLPAWVQRQLDGSFVINPDEVFPSIALALGTQEYPLGSGKYVVVSENLDQFWLECIYQIAKLEVQRFCDMYAEIDPRRKDPPMAILVVMGTGSEGQKERWAQRNFDPGAGSVMATKGKMARHYYTLLRGKMPGQPEF